MALKDLAAAFNLTKQSKIIGKPESGLPNEFAKAGLDARLIPISLRYCSFESALNRQESARYYFGIGITPTIVGFIFVLATNSWLRFANNLGISVMLIGLFFIAKGTMHLLKIDIKALDTSGLPYQWTSLLTSEELINKERAKRMTRSTVLFWAKAYGVVTGFATFIVVLNAAGPEPELIFMLLPAVIAGSATWLGSLFVMRKAIDRPIDPYTPQLPTKTSPYRESYSIPMSTTEEYLKSESQIVTSKLADPSWVWTTTGGPVNMTGNEGLVYIAEEGIVFLPADPDSQGSLGKEISAKAVATLAGQIVPVLGEVMGGFSKSDDDRPLVLERFTSESLKNPAHFTIPWRRLVKASSDTSTNRITVVRQEVDGSETPYFFELAGHPQFPRELMVQRFEKEVRDARMAVEFPIMFKHREELMPKYREIYGDRLEDYIHSVTREAYARSARDLKLDPSLLHKRIKEELKQVIPHFAEIEILNERYPTLF
ncbi:MAG: hypothetical protein KME02_02050 [Aphanothece saxicola GSE-SYN-MK-01-06B]|nr:hypothetical protein [Aphanothece saxicola GSE-SYN-MK-01-06B]